MRTSPEHARCISIRTAPLVVIWVYSSFLVAHSGCNASVQPPSSQRINSQSLKSQTALHEVNAGVVLGSRSGYLCLLLEQIGLSPDDKVTAVSSSCECIRPRLIAVATSGATTAQAVFLQYVDELSSLEDVPTEDSQIPPANLGVIIHTTLASGITHEFTVNLLHSHEVQEKIK